MTQGHRAALKAALGGAGQGAASCISPGVHPQAAFPGPGVCVWPSAPRLHLVSRGWGRKAEILSSELSFNGASDQFRSLLGAWEAGGVNTRFTPAWLRPASGALLQEERESRFLLAPARPYLGPLRATGHADAGSMRFTYVGGNILDIYFAFF